MGYTQTTAVVLLVAACGAPKAERGALVEILTEDAQIAEQRLGGASLTLPYELQNQGSGGATLEAIDWTLSLDGEPPAKGNVRPNTTVAAGQAAAATLTVEAKVSTTDEAFAARAEAPAQRFVVQANFKVATSAGASEFTAEWTGELFPARRPSLRVEPQALRAENDVELHFVLAIKNPNPFPLPVSRLQYVIAVEDTEVSKGELARGQMVAAGSELQFDVSRFVGRDDLHELEKRIAKQASIAYQVQSELELEGRTFADRASGTMSFAR